MKPDKRSNIFLGITRSKAKMYEYSIPEKEHIRIPRNVNPAQLFSLAIGILGDNASAIANANGDASTPDKANNTSLDPASLRFCTRFFDAFLEARLKEEINLYLLLVGSAAYYLNDRPGSAQVLLTRIKPDDEDLDCHNLDTLLHWILSDNWSEPLVTNHNEYGRQIGTITKSLTEFSSIGSGANNAIEQVNGLRSRAYRHGTSRELFFTDLIGAVLRKRLDNSTWTCLPRYSGIDISNWISTLQKPGFMREMWPAQRLLGEMGVLSGKSAIVQFPTSAGKTHAVEVILRSAFLSGRAKVAIVVAPFRALCHEISSKLIGNFAGEDTNVNEVSDVLQMDLLAEFAEFLGEEFSQKKVILVVTPEKLLYMFRHAPEIAKHIGLLILDEGHQFDSGARGVTYELLITALRPLLNNNVQLVLISAVIPNAEQIAAWLIGEDAVTVKGNTLLPTERSVAFSSWTTARGQLQFINPADEDTEHFFVPRVLEEITLRNRPRERNKRVFPARNSTQAIAVYLGLKLAPQGGVAVFCGRKDSVVSINNLIVDAYDRGLPFPYPANFSDPDEMRRLHFLHSQHFGEDESSTKCARWGIFSHHGSTPHGIRLAVEHAMKQGLARFVVCTSTLAQGVNLPIRYLVVTSTYQGADRIKVRDFQNLIGRTGRSGMHTEGTILFSDPSVYDGRNDYRDNWRWTSVTNLLNQENLEPCASSLLSILDPFISDGGQLKMELSTRQLVEAYVSNLNTLTQNLRDFAQAHTSQAFSVDGIMRQLEWKVTLLGAIESYLMAHRNPDATEPFAEEALKLAKQTLAYFLGSTDQQIQLGEVFQILAHHIDTTIPDREKQKSYGKTLFGVNNAIKIETWANEQLSALLICTTEEEILNCLWPLFEECITYRMFKRCDKPEALRELCVGWISGTPYYQLLHKLSETGAKRVTGLQKREFRIEDVVDLCENALGYEATLIVSGMADIIQRISSGLGEDTIALLLNLQKRLRYGLQDKLSILLFEMGFADRAVVNNLGQIFIDIPTSRQELRLLIRNSEGNFLGRLEKYPSYFQQVYANVFDHQG